MENKNIGISILKSLIFSYILTGIILCILAFIMYQTEVSTKVANLGVTLTYVAASVFAGFIIGKQMGKRKFLWGLAVGLLYFAVLFLISLLLDQNQALMSGERITAMLLCAAGGTLGGALA